MKKLLSILGFIIIISSCEQKTEVTFCNKIPLETATVENEIEYQIINAILEKYYYPGKNILQVNQETDSTWKTIDDFKEFFEQEKIDYDLTYLTDYVSKNDTSYFLSKSLLNSSVQLISQEELDCLFSNDETGWEKYYHKYPKLKGFFSFSRPGINTLGNKAIIEYYWAGDYLAAMWYIVILEKSGNDWNVVQSFLTGIAK